MATIKITPEELREASSFIAQKGTEASNDIAALRSKVAAVTAAWEGAAQSSFIASFEGMKDLFDQFPQVIEGISQQLKGAADALEQADTEVAKAFK